MNLAMNTVNLDKWTLYIRDDVDQSVFNEIFKVKEYRSADEAIKNAKYPIIDVGAHAGFFSFYCRLLNKNVKIYAIEPELKNSEMLKRHINENQIEDIKVIEGALAAQTGKRILILGKDSHNHRLSESKSNEEEFQMIHAYSFSDFCKTNKLNRISLLKMDIEGGEYEIFKSLSESDLNMVNFVILEYHGKEYVQIENKLRENGFGVQVFPSQFDKTMGFLFAKNKRFK